MNDFERHVQQTARHFVYPPTPDIRVGARKGTVRRTPTPAVRRMAWAVPLALIVLIMVLMAVPPIRAAVLEFLQIGAVRVTQTDDAVPETLPRVLTDLGGETTLDETRALVDFDLMFPADYGEPDRVYVQSGIDQMVIMVWLDEDDPERIALSLYQIGPDGVGVNKLLERFTETEVNGEQAVWAEGPHLLEYRRGGSDVYEETVLVQGNVLIWTADDVTYRLETGLDLAEAVQIAESLSAMP